MVTPATHIVNTNIKQMGSQDETRCTTRTVFISVKITSQTCGERDLVEILVTNKAIYIISKIKIITTPEVYWLEFLSKDPAVPGSFPGNTIFPEK
jgi:hypothetical protein